MLSHARGGRSEDKLASMALSSHYEGPRSKIQVVRFGHKLLYPKSHVANQDHRL